MSIFIELGSVLLDVLCVVCCVVGNLVFKDEFGKVIQDVESGCGFLDLMCNCGWFFILFLFMIVVGECFGVLGEMFWCSVDQLDQDVDCMILVGLNFLELGIILVFGVVVVIIVLLIMFFIFQINIMVFG